MKQWFNAAKDWLLGNGTLKILAIAITIVLYFLAKVPVMGR